MSERDPEPTDPAAEEPPALTPEDILVVRRGPGANCSSIGSALDVLFLSAVAGSAILAAVAAALPSSRSRPPARPDLPAPPREREEGDARSS